MDISAPSFRTTPRQGGRWLDGVGGGGEEVIIISQSVMGTTLEISLLYPFIDKSRNGRSTFLYKFILKRLNFPGCFVTD